MFDTIHNIKTNCSLRENTSYYCGYWEPRLISSMWNCVGCGLDLNNIAIIDGVVFVSFGFAFW